MSDDNVPNSQRDAGTVEGCRAVQEESSFLSQTVQTAGANAVITGFGFLTGMLAARLLGPAGRGELAAIQVFPTMVASLGVLGVTEALVYFAAREPSKGGRWFASGMALTVLSSIPFALGAYLLMPVILRAQAPAVVEAARFYLLIVLLSATVGLFTFPMQGLGKIARWNVMRLLPALVWLVVLLLGWARGTADAAGLSRSYLLGYAALALPFALLALPKLGGPFRVEPRLWRPLLGYGLPSVLAFVPAMLNVRLDQMLMAAFLSPESLGLYVVAVSWSGALLRVLLQAIASVLVPRIASEKLDPARQSARLGQGARLGVITVVPALVVLALITPLVLPLLFGSPYSRAIPAALVLLVAAGFDAFSGVLRAGLRGLGFPGDVLWGEILGLVVTAVCLALLLRPLDLMGAAIASLVSYLVVMIVLAQRVTHRTPLSLGDLLLPRASEVTATLSRARAGRLR